MSKWFVLFLVSVSISSYATGADALFVGDSIAEGYKLAKKGTGLTRVGASPKMVNTFLNRVDLKNQLVVLSTGVSNDCQDLGTVSKNINYVSDRAKGFMLLGTLKCNKQTQDWLKLTCMNLHNCVYFPVEQLKSRDGVHPARYE